MTSQRPFTEAFHRYRAMVAPARPSLDDFANALFTERPEPFLGWGYFLSYGSVMLMSHTLKTSSRVHTKHRDLDDPRGLIRRLVRPQQASDPIVDETGINCIAEGLAAFIGMQLLELPKRIAAASAASTPPLADLCRDLVRLTVYDEKRAVFDVSIVPGAKITWTFVNSYLPEYCDKKLPWFKIVSNELIKLSAAGDIPVQFSPDSLGLKPGLFYIYQRAAADELAICEFADEFLNGQRMTGYEFTVPVERFARILRGIAAQLEQAYA